jgi:hypothetical protein
MIFSFILKKNPLAVKFGILYAGRRILNGIGHNVATIITGRYFDGFAGGFSGIGLVIIRIPLLLSLWRISGMKSGEK